MLGLPFRRDKLFVRFSPNSESVAFPHCSNQARPQFFDRDIR